MLKQRRAIDHTSTLRKRVEHGACHLLALRACILVDSQRIAIGLVVQATSSFISRTALSNPTMIARAMMQWPIYNSLMPSRAAMGRTLR